MASKFYLEYINGWIIIINNKLGLLWLVTPIKCVWNIISKDDVHKHGFRFWCVYQLKAGTAYDVFKCALSFSVAYKPYYIQNNMCV